MQPVPEVTAADVERLTAREFPQDATAVGQAMAGHEPRVQAAILKLAAGDRGQVDHFTEEALIDYRDVLSMAEYPEAAQIPGFLHDVDPNELAPIVDRDWQQYATWFDAEQAT